MECGHTSMECGHTSMECGHYGLPNKPCDYLLMLIMVNNEH